MSVRTINQLAEVIGETPRGCARCGEPFNPDEKIIVEYDQSDGHCSGYHSRCELIAALDRLGDAVAAGARF